MSVPATAAAAAAITHLSSGAPPRWLSGQRLSLCPYNSYSKRSVLRKCKRCHPHRSRGVNTQVPCDSSEKKARVTSSVPKCQAAREAEGRGQRAAAIPASIRESAFPHAHVLAQIRIQIRIHQGLCPVRGCSRQLLLPAALGRQLRRTDPSPHPKPHRPLFLLTCLLLSPTVTLA